MARTYIHGTTLDGQVPTCLTGGNPPTGCPFDELFLLSNKITIQPLTTGSGRSRRNFATTPATCPASGSCQTPVTFYYGDGSVDHVVTKQPCTRSHATHGKHRRRRHRPRHRAEPRAGAV